MKAAVRHGYGKALRQPDLLSFGEAADPTIEISRDVIVRIGGASVYRADLHITSP